LRTVHATARHWLVAATLVLAACGEPEVPTEPVVAGDTGAVATIDTPVGTARPAPRRGLWVLCEGSQRVLEHPERIPALIDDARQLGVSDLFIQVYRGGRAWFDSSQVDAAPYRSILERTGRDTLAELLPLAHAAGLRVHAWVNVLSLAGNTQSDLIAELGRDAVLVDGFGRSLLDYPELDVPEPDRRYYRMGTPAVYLDPAAPGVAERLAAIFGELLVRYPELDGLHLDYIRYPDVLPFIPGSRFGVGLDFGYGAATRARFATETGLEARFGAAPAVANRWDAWRRDQVTRLVATLRGTADAFHPDTLLSAAVWAYADRAYLALGQDWRGWLDDGLLDFAVPMAYTLDDRLLGYLAESFAGSPSGDRIWLGLGCWLFRNSPERAIEQLRIVRATGAGGDSLFSWDSIADAPELREALIREASRGS
jgi:uncharacterized lipoprotein YddW (UPF0748 family)